MMAKISRANHFWSWTMLLFSCILCTRASSICSKFSLVIHKGHCANLSSTLPYFVNFCSAHNGTMDERCCLNADSLLGLDLSSCNLHNFTSATVTGQNSNLTVDIVLLALAPNNPKLKLPSPEAFIGQINLQQLLMPKLIGCPTGWSEQTTSIAFDNDFDAINNDTEEFIRCLPPPNPCLSDDACPVNTSSQCTLTGPGLFACPCQSGWTGYKCLRSSQPFPYPIFGIGWAGSALAACLIGWLLERRGIVKVNSAGMVATVQDDHSD
ncbi:hypothetical protein BOX15_Mlig001938g1 [Macrostomum lignano]|uniref:EGF-like domain-containing protein n=1 Tax=Macrostomum lignano TaxID=282301 RepID=A0A267H773_9PLAT|nr:hypothetical protein BOX15_Mlig001938g1 [Macrostomum lignano]